MTPIFHLRRCTLLLVVLLPAASSSAAGATSDSTGPLYDRFEVPVEVSGLPANAEFVPVSCDVDCNALLQRLGRSGAVDERSLRLYRVLPDGSRREQPVQLLACEQPRAAQRQFLPATVSGVSYLTEVAAGEAASDVKTHGELWWIAQSDKNGRANYRLVFGVLRRGRAIQVPYPPQNWRMFDEQDRATPLAYFPRMHIRPQWPLDGVLNVTDDGQSVTTYHVGPQWDSAQTGTPVIRRPFLYPVNGPDGISLTEFGKAHDRTGSHRHHYSLWIAHNKVAGHDFWSDSGGLILHKEIVLLEDGPIFCRLVVRTRWRDGETDLLDEERGLTVYHAGDGFRLMDFDLQFRPAGKEPVALEQTTFGFLAVRVAQSLTPFDGGGEMLNARGQRNEQNVHQQRAEWLDQSGPILPDRWSGIAILDHPLNPNHPTMWHCRNDGWAGAAFCGEKPYTIEPDRPLPLRYRVVLHRGDAVQGRVADHWQAYAAKPKVQLGEPQRAP
ncbi:MAG TPA: PmoA family protein [Candidatus Anammoximicrobium sp.]|mgnify:CR=1 FL=1|nr:PmoA family protein [Candidatus Anammoximicrobium sp.]